MSDAALLSIWVVYDHPRDFPDEFIARRHETTAHGSRVTDEVLLSSSLDAIRDELAKRGLYCLTRVPGDDPKIVETWL